MARSTAAGLGVPLAAQGITAWAWISDPEGRSPRIRFPEFVPLLVVLGYGPTFAALLVTAALGGRPAVRDLLGRLLIWRVGWRWWAVTLFLNAGVVLGALGLYGLCSLCPGVQRVFDARERRVFARVACLPHAL